MKKTIHIIIVMLLFLMLNGCASNSNKAESPYLATLGDFSPFELGEAMSLWKDGNGVSPCELDLYCVPRTNKIEVYFSSLINKVCLMMSAENCEQFEKAVNEYMTAYNTSSFDKNHKPTKKNAYGSMKTNIAWGVFGYGYNAEIQVLLNYEIIGGKPYFSMSMSQGEAKEESKIYSPSMTMYFTPSQLETIIELTDSDRIAEYIKTLETEAFSFDYEF